MSNLGCTIEASISTGGGGPTADPIKIFPDRPSRALLVQVTIGPIKRKESVSSRHWPEQQITGDSKFLKTSMQDMSEMPAWVMVEKNADPQEGPEEDRKRQTTMQPSNIKPL